MSRRAVFLDRDGVLNRAWVRQGKPRPPASLAEVEVLPGVRQGCTVMRSVGFLLVGVTNQPDVARGLQGRRAVEEINELLRRELELDEIRVCWHDDAAGCACRKPQPGLLLAAARRWEIALGRSYMIGDRFKDIEAGRRAGCRTILIGDGYGEAPLATPDFRCGDLRAAAQLVLEAA